MSALFHRLTCTCAAALLGLGILAASPAAHADEIGDEIRNALRLYEQGKVAEAKDSLEFATQMLAQKKAAGLETFFPKPLSGWSVEDGGSASGGAFGGGITASKTYSKGDDSVDITIIGDSPMMQGLAMMFGNPALAGSGGAKVRRIKGQKALVTTEGEIQIMVGKFLVTIDGNAPDEAKVKYAEALPFEGLEKF